MGFIQELFSLFLPLSDLQPFITEKKVCQTCEFNSIQEYYDWYVGKRLKRHCEVCSEDSLTTVVCFDFYFNELALNFTFEGVLIFLLF